MPTAMLEDLPPFSALSDASLQLLRRDASTHRLRGGDAVLYKGQPISGAYFVIDGQLRVYSTSPDGNEATLYFLNPGETCVFALNSLFNDLRYPAWVEAGCDTRVALIPGPLFRTLFEHEPAIRDVTVRALSTLVFRLMHELEDVHAYRLDQRLANLLLVHAAADGVVRMTQQQIAGHLGTTREVVARLMCELVASGEVQTARGRILLKSPRQLAQRLEPA